MSTRCKKPVFRRATFDEFGDMLSVDDLALLFKKTTSCIVKWCQSGQLPNAVKIGKSWYVPKVSIMKTFGLEV